LLIVGVDNLRVFDAEATLSLALAMSLTWTNAVKGFRKGVDSQPVRKISYCVNIYLESSC
jgi:hypothetical protein